MGPRNTSVDSGTIFEALEDRLLMSVTLDNGVAPGTAGYWAVTVDKAGSTRSTQLGMRDTIYQYCGFIEDAGSVYRLSDYALDPTITSSNTAQSLGRINLPDGGKIEFAIDSSIAPNALSMVNTYYFLATGTDLKAARFLQYMDCTLGVLSDTEEILLVSGQTSDNSLVLTTVGPSLGVKQSLSSGQLNGSVLSGFAADQWDDLETTILAGGLSTPAGGNITAALPRRSFTGLGFGYGPNIITVATAYNFTSSPLAQVTTIMGAVDNSTPPPPPPVVTTTPTLIVPDFMGSMPTTGTAQGFLSSLGAAPTDLQAENFLHRYDPIQDTMTSLGIDAKQILFGAYDWRLPIAPADGLNDGMVDMSSVNFSDATFQYGVEYLDYWLKQAEGAWLADHSSLDRFSINVVADGTGGLLVRSLLQSQYGQDNYGNYIRQVVCVGMPNEGTAQAFTLLDGDLSAGDLLSAPFNASGDLPDTAMFSLLWHDAQRLGTFDDVGDWSPSLYDMLPTQSGYVQAFGTTVAPDMSQFANPLLTDLNTDPHLFTDRTGGRYSDSQEHLLYSGDVTTLQKVQYVMNGVIQPVTTTDGDGVVSMSSAMLSGQDDVNRFVRWQVPHEQLMVDAGMQQAIMRALGYTQGFRPAAQDWSVGMTKFVSGSFASSDFMITDSVGRRLGYSTSGGTINEIPNASITADGTSAFFFIPSPDQSGDFTVKATGRDDGYNGEIFYENNGNSRQSVYSGYLAAGQSDQFALTDPQASNDVVTAQAAGMLTAPGQTRDYQFVVNYALPAGLDVSSLGSGEIAVLAPDGSTRTASVAGVGAAGQVAYSLSAPAGGWSATDYGTYQILLVGGKVKDLDSSIVAGQSLGSFDINEGQYWRIGIGGPVTLHLSLGGSQVTLSLKGPGTGTVVLPYADQNTLDIQLDDTTARSSFTMKSTGTPPTVESLIVSGSIGSVSTTSAVTGGVDIAGTVGKIQLGDLTGSNALVQPTLSIDALALPAPKLSLTLGRVKDFSIDSHEPVATLSAAYWTDTAGTLVDNITAPSIDALTTRGIKGNARRGIAAVAGNFQADMNVSSLGKVQVNGDLTNALWNVNGNIGKMSVVGWIDHSMIRSSLSMASITAGGSSSSDFLAGITSTTGRFADSPDDFAEPSQIGSFKIAGWRLPRGQALPTLFVDSNVSAAFVGTVNLLNGDFVTGHSSINALKGSVAPIKKVVSKDLRNPLASWTYRADRPYVGPVDLMNIL